MQALRKCFSILVLSIFCSAAAAQDIGAARVGNSNALPPSVALEMRIQTLIDELGISGEQEPSFRVAMKQVHDLETAYLDEHRENSKALASDAAVLAASEKLLALVLYPTQVSAFREMEQEHLWQMRGQH